MNNQNAIDKIKLRTESKKSAVNIEKRIRYLQRELVRASFMGEEKMSMCKQLLNLIKKERMKIQALTQSLN